MRTALSGLYFLPLTLQQLKMRALSLSLFVNGCLFVNVVVLLKSPLPCVFSETDGTGSTHDSSSLASRAHSMDVELFTPGNLDELLGEDTPFLTTPAAGGAGTSADSETESEFWGSFSGDEESSSGDGYEDSDGEMDRFEVNMLARFRNMLMGMGWDVGFGEDVEVL